MQGAERLYAMQQIGKAKYGLGEAGATALASSSEEEVGKLGENKEFTNSMKSSSELAAQTLTSSQRLESIQRNLVQIVMGLSVTVVGGFAQLVRTSIQQLAVISGGEGGAGMKILSRMFGGDAASVSKDLQKVMDNKTLRGLSSGGTMARGMNMMASGVSGLNTEFKHQFGAAANQVQGGFSYDMSSLREDALGRGLTPGTAAWTEYMNKAQKENPALFQNAQENANSAAVSSGAKAHSGGTFTGVSKVLTNEFFTPLSHHSGGITGKSGNAFTLDPSALSNDEAFMVSPRPMQVQTPTQFGKSQGANGPTYNMNFSITGVATKSDIIQTFTKAVNEAMG